jgi:hypothetical protein
MKKNAFKIMVRRMSGALLVSFLVFVNGASAQTTVAAAFHENAVAVNYIGTDKGSYVFNVAYNNEYGDKFLLRILDASGNILFAGAYNDKKFEKRFRLEKDGNGKLKFIIKNLKDHSTQTFDVIATERVVEDVVVRKVI